MRSAKSPGDNDATSRNGRPSSRPRSSSRPPQRPRSNSAGKSKVPFCRFFARDGKCTFQGCTFQHKPACRDYQKGTCQHGDNGRFPQLIIGKPKEVAMSNRGRSPSQRGRSPTPKGKRRSPRRVPSKDNRRRPSPRPGSRQAAGAIYTVLPMHESLPVMPGIPVC